MTPTKVARAARRLRRTAFVAVWRPRAEESSALDHFAKGIRAKVVRDSTTTPCKLNRELDRHRSGTAMKIARWAARLGGASVALLALGIGFVRAKRADASDLEQLKPGIYRVRNFISDVYVARAGSDVLLFDAGLDPEGRAIDAALGAAGATRGDVSHVFLTHSHADHVAGAGLFPHARVHIGAADVAMLAQREPARPLRPRLFGAVVGSSPHTADALLHQRE